MRRIQFLYILLFLICHQVHAQIPMDGFDPMNNTQMDPSMRPQNPDSSNVEIISLPPKLYMWKISEELGNIIPVPVDTASHQFQNSNLVEGMKGHYNYLGNLGSPRLTRIYFDRNGSPYSFFLNPFDEFVTQPWQQNFTNSNIPYTNLSYYTTFNKQYGEDRFKSYFSVNVNKQLAFGFNFDYLYGRGYYASQSTSYLKGGLFGSYVGDKYRAHIVYNAFNMKMGENGGIEDDRYITDPEMMADGRKEYESMNIPVNLSNTWNYNKNFYIHFTHRYNLGFHKDMVDIKNEKDTISEFVPVTSFIHTFRVERARHSFMTNDSIDQVRYLSKWTSVGKDSTTYLGVKNTIGISLLEGFNKYAKAGLTAFISHKYSKYELMDSANSVMGRTNFTEQEMFLGAELIKRQGKLLHYNAIGEIGLGGVATGQFRANGNADLNFRLWKDTVNVIARASVSNTLPAFYMRHYHSKYRWWDNENMDKEFRVRLEGELNIENWQTNIKAGVENIKNYAYLDQTANPAQTSENIQILSATLNQNFRLGILHLDNEVTWQKSSNNTILPLPELSLYHNLYIQTKLAKKVLSLQMGVDLRYFSKYNAPAYDPFIQQFSIQDSENAIEIGNYPIVNVYANLHLKRTRFFVMMYHVNQGMSNPNYFLAPHYPINQRLIKFGLSWNFYD